MSKTDGFRDEQIMKDDEYTQYHSERFAELSEWIIAKSVSVIQKALNYGDVLLIQEHIKENPVFWVAPYHHGWGTAIRNLLRDKVCTDDKLPGSPEDKNWDNYYVYLVEVAIGLRLTDGERIDGQEKSS